MPIIMTISMAITIGKIRNHSLRRQGRTEGLALLWIFNLRRANFKAAFSRASSDLAPEQFGSRRNASSTCSIAVLKAHSAAPKVFFFIQEFPLFAHNALCLR